MCCPSGCAKRPATRQQNPAVAPLRHGPHTFQSLGAKGWRQQQSLLLLRRPDRGCQNGGKTTHRSSGAEAAGVQGGDTTSYIGSGRLGSVCRGLQLLQEEVNEAPSSMCCYPSCSCRACSQGAPAQDTATSSGKERTARVTAAGASGAAGPLSGPLQHTPSAPGLAQQKAASTAQQQQLICCYQCGGTAGTSPLRMCTAAAAAGAGGGR
jgi:hypothetical protein